MWPVSRPRFHLQFVPRLGFVCWPPGSRFPEREQNFHARHCTAAACGSPRGNSVLTRRHALHRGRLLGLCESEALREAAIAVTAILRRLPNVDERAPEIKTPPCGRPDNEHRVVAIACSALDCRLQGRQFQLPHASFLSARSSELPLRTAPAPNWPLMASTVRSSTCWRSWASPSKRSPCRAVSRLSRLAPTPSRRTGSRSAVRLRSKIVWVASNKALVRLLFSVVPEHGAESGNPTSESSARPSAPATPRGAAGPPIGPSDRAASLAAPPAPRCPLERSSPC